MLDNKGYVHMAFLAKTATANMNDVYYGIYAPGAVEVKLYKAGQVNNPDSNMWSLAPRIGIAIDSKGEIIIFADGKLTSMNYGFKIKDTAPAQ